MILLVSDLHLGKDPATDQASLSDLKTCIDSFSPELEHVVFLGDTFDAFIEYPGRIPRNVHLWTDMALNLQESGLRVSYYQGNHDRWHSSHIENTLGIPVHRTSTVDSHGGNQIWLEHGDRSVSNSWPTRWGRIISDHRLTFHLYTLGLPFGLGHRLAAWVSRRFSNSDPDPETAKQMHDHALSVLKSHRAHLVVMGHCHQASLTHSPDGVYANTGDWYQSRTFLTVSDRISLLKWTNTGSNLILEVDFSSRDNISGSSDV